MAQPSWLRCFLRFNFGTITSSAFERLCCDFGVLPTFSVQSHQGVTSLSHSSTTLRRVRGAPSMVICNEWKYNYTEKSWSASLNHLSSSTQTWSNTFKQGIIIHRLLLHYKKSAVEAWLFLYDQHFPFNAAVGSDDSILGTASCCRLAQCNINQQLVNIRAILRIHCEVSQNHPIPTVFFQAPSMYNARSLFQVKH